MGIARSTYYDSPAINIDDTALVEVMAAISNTFEAFMVIAACRLRFGIAA